MRALAVLFALLACAPAHALSGVVTHVTDGDTLWVRPEAGRPVKVRLQGIDAPERCQARGAQSREALAGRVLHRQVDVRTRAKDDYRRTIGTVTLDGHDVAAWMVREGHALIGTTPTPEAFARALLAQPEVKPIGLGARNSLRLEAGLCLYGNDIDTTTTPVEAGLGWAMQKVRRSGGARAGGFPGAERVLAQLDGREPVTRKRVGLVALERVPVREHTELQDAQGARIGEVTSGLLGPSVDKPIAMGYLPPQVAAPGTRIIALRDNPRADAGTTVCVARHLQRANEFCSLARDRALGEARDAALNLAHQLAALVAQCQEGNRLGWEPEARRHQRRREAREVGVQPRLVDVRDPENLTSCGYATWGASEVWDSYWVPVYNKAGVATGKKTNLVYSVDLVRGLDVYVVDVPGDGVGTVPSVEIAPSLAVAPGTQRRLHLAVGREAGLRHLLVG